MKIIALMIVKNESWILPTTLPQTLKFVDEILVMDGNSTDNTLEILKAHSNVYVRAQTEKDNYASWRQQLLEWGREIGGTHFLCIDADEALSSDLLPTFRTLIEELKPGQKLVLDWIALWKSPNQYLDDETTFSKLYKDFVFCDDGTSNYSTALLHEGRTPGENTEQNWIRVPREKGVMLHFQFVPFKRFQVKQAFQRCREHTLKTASPIEINYKYEITLDNPKAKCSETPKKWIEGIQIPEDLSTKGQDWFYPAIIEYFDKNSIEYYEPLQIWHVQELHEEFVKRIDRPPRPKSYGNIAKKMRKTITYVFAKLPKKIQKVIIK